MTAETTIAADPQPKAVQTRAAKARATKAAIVAKLLMRAKGATLADIGKATDWQPHTCRAFLTGLRKKGWAIERSNRDDGTTIWNGRAPGSARDQG